MDQKNKKMDLQFIIILVMIGIFAGFLSGLVGIGGGIVIVPALVFFLGFSQLQAQGTSLAMIMLPVGILGVLQYYKQGYVDFNYVLVIAAGFVLGSFLGSKLTLSIPQDVVKKTFAILLLIVSVKMLFFDKPKSSGTKESTEVRLEPKQPA
jgi:uncharacterized protein